MNKLILFSPAKLNLFFRVLKKRSDGFHEIASLYQTINLGDSLCISLNDGGDSLICNDSFIPTDNSNLVLKAAELFRIKTGLKQHFAFNLDKKVPIEAGLGGGSSNAATTLWGLNRLMKTKIKDEELALWAKELGSDVPFFLTKGRAYCEGRGEILSPQASLDLGSFWLAKPKEGLSTPAVYQKLNLEDLEKWDPEKALHLHQTGCPFFFNDLEKPAFEISPKLNGFKKDLLEMGFNQVHMTGSGTAFFCLGGMENPWHSQMSFYSVRFLNREGENWYKFPQ